MRPAFSGAFQPLENDSLFVMAGLRPGHPRLSCLSEAKTWMPGTKPGHDELRQKAHFIGCFFGQALRMRSSCWMRSQTLMVRSRAPCAASRTTRPPGKATDSTEPENALRQVADALDTGCGHGLVGGFERAGQIDRPAACFEQHRLEAKPAGVDRGIIDAEIGGEPGQKNSSHAALAKIARQACRRAPVIFVECGIGIDFRPETLADHQLRPVNTQHRMKAGARRALHAMIGPQRLLSVRHGDALKRRRTRMAGGE